jgi:pimeloyl-ACP methyl ester carboxylesterase
MAMSDAAAVVFVHGGWGGSWCWDRVTPLLDARGIRWSAVDLPTCSPQPNAPATLSDDAATVRAAIDAAGGPCVVLGHSYGGMVITQACAGHPNVTRLVYLAAFMPDADESIRSLSASGEPNPDFISAIKTDADGWSTLDAETAPDLLYHDCDANTVAWAAANFRPMRGGIGENVTAAAWRGIPSTYVITEQDKGVLPSVQRTMSDRATDVVSWDTSHSPFASRPELVADLLERLVGS